MRINDPAAVARQYASEGNLAARRSLYAIVEGPDRARDRVRGDRGMFSGVVCSRSVRPGRACREIGESWLRGRRGRPSPADGRARPRSWRRRPRGRRAGLPFPRRVVRLCARGVDALPPARPRSRPRRARARASPRRPTRRRDERRATHGGAPRHRRKRVLGDGTPFTARERRRALERHFAAVERRDVVRMGRSIEDRRRRSRVRRLTRRRRAARAAALRAARRLAVAGASSVFVATAGGG